MPASFRCRCGQHITVSRFGRGAPGASTVASSHDVLGGASSPAHSSEPVVVPQPSPAAAPPPGPVHVEVPADLLAKYALPSRPAASRYVTEEDDEGSFLINIALPLVLLVVGALMWLGQAGYVARDPTQSLPRLAGLVVLGLIVNIAVTLAGCFVSAMLFNVNFGSISKTILKLAAIAVLAGAVGSLIVGMDRDRLSITGMIVAWHMVILIYFVCFHIFFPLDLQENLMTVAIIGVMQAMMLLIVWAT